MNAQHSSIHHRVEIEASAAQVYAALTESSQLAAWWTREAEAGAHVGEVSRFWFGQGSPAVEMQIRELQPDIRVAWTCVAGPWRGHELRFDIEAHERGACLRFCHEGWASEDDFFAHCSTKWGWFLAASLKPLLEGGQGAPHPDEPRI